VAHSKDNRIGLSLAIPSSRAPATHTARRLRLSRIRNLWRDDSGQAFILTTAGLLCLLGFVGFAADMGMLLRAKLIMQTAADAAAIAGAAELNYKGTLDQWGGSVSAAAKAAATQNGVTDGVKGATVTVNNPPAGGSHTGSGYVEVIASQSQPTIFMQLFQSGKPTVAARAVAGLPSSHACLYTLKASGTGILANGSLTISLPGCAIYDNSADSTQAMLLNGSGSLTAKSIGVVGHVLKNGGFATTPTPVTGIAPVTDPLSYLSPPNSGTCSANPNINGSGTYNLNAGCYNGLTINGSATVNLNAGTYYINGALTFNGSGTISGTGVMFYTTGASVFNGSQTLNLAAPTSGTYNGILFFQSRSVGTSVIFNGSNSSSLKGILYYPAAQLTMNGSSSTNLYTSIVASSCLFNGSLSLKDYALVNANSPLSMAALME